MMEAKGQQVARPQEEPVPRIGKDRHQEIVSETSIRLSKYLCKYEQLMTSNSMLRPNHLTSKGKVSHHFAPVLMILVMRVLRLLVLLSLSTERLSQKHWRAGSSTMKEVERVYGRRM